MPTDQSTPVAHHDDNERAQPGQSVDTAPSTQDRAITHHWRLRGTVDDTEFMALLHEGESIVGSAREADVVLPERGVSRRHARLTVEAHASFVTVQDLGSKNGCHVAGVRFDRQEVRHGAEVAFGPVVLVLETIPAGDATLGIELSRDGDASTVARVTPRPTTRLTRGGLSVTFEGWLRLVAEAAEYLARPVPSDLDGMLERVRRALDLRGVALSTARPDAPPAMLAAVGATASLPRVATDTAGSGETIHAQGGERIDDKRVEDTVWTTAARTDADGTTLGLTLWGDFEDRAASDPLLAALLALCLSRRDRPGTPADALAPLSRDAAMDQPLCFPEGYVPGAAPAMRSLYQQMTALAASELPILIVGETGVGKEPVARALHATSARARHAFVGVNCAAIPAELLEAELFGIGRGVATGVDERRGRFAEASGGTIFLDEIGDMPAALQAKLLRVLEEREIQPLGRPAHAIDVRVLAATHRDLLTDIETGRFRRDLYYRIAGSVLRVAPLRERREDIPHLVGHFLRRTAQAADKPVRGLTVKALEHLTHHDWPGNVRELEHEVRRLVHVVAQGGVIDSSVLSDTLLAVPANPLLHIENTAFEESGASFALAPQIEAVERQVIERVLAKTGGNQSRAARLLGVSRNGLTLRMKRLGVELPDG